MAKFFTLIFSSVRRIDSKGDIEEIGSELSEKDMLPVYRGLPVNSGYRAGKLSDELAAGDWCSGFSLKSHRQFYAYGVA